MLERLIYTALATGIAELVADPKVGQRLFSILKGLSTEEARKLVDLFRRQPPTVMHNYPRDDSKFPLFAIVLGEENESTKFMDDAGGVIDADEAEYIGDTALAGAFKRTSVYTSTYHIWTVTLEPDVTLAFYQIAKYILSQKRRFLKEHGVLDSAFSGSDLVPSKDYLPAYLFIRRLTLVAQFEEPVFDDPLGAIRSVDGIFVDDSLDGVDATAVDVIPRVTPIEE